MILAANGNASWWLRSPGANQKFPAAIFSDGSIYYFNETDVVETVGVRPLIRVNY